MAELHRVFSPDILSYIITNNFAEVESRSISTILRATVLSSKAQSPDNHAVDMLDAICSDDFCARTSWSSNLCLC